MKLFDLRTRYLHIVLNDEVFRGDPFSLFSSEEFEEIRLVTYVSSPEFFFTKLRNFKKVLAVLGEEETAREFYPFLYQFEGKFLESIQNDTTLLRALYEGRFRLRFLCKSKIVHSKIYILINDKDRVRVAVGSANFTKSAFGDSDQFEELVVYDSDYNRKFCEIYLERFEEIFKVSSDFLSDLTRKKIEKLLMGVIENPLITQEEKVDILLEKVKVLSKNEGDATEFLKLVQSEKETLKERSALVERVEKILEHTTRKTREGLSFNLKLNDQQIRDKLKEIVSVSHHRSADLLDRRNALIFREDLNEVWIREPDSSLARPYSLQSLPQEILREELQRLNNFVRSYQIFCIRNDLDHLKRVFEAVLFALTSPLIHLIRRHVKEERSDEKLAEIPIFLIIGGHPNTGKTKLLLFINKLLGNCFEIFTYKDVYTRSQKILRDLLESENIFPILVDEIYDNFFRGEGERLIKTLTNTLVQPHPVMIGTTNVSFTAEGQVIRRIYYLHFDNPFPEDKVKKAEAEKYFEENVSTPRDLLFRYFLSKFLSRMREEENFYRMEDPLFLSRRIIRELYAEAGLDIPEFISDTLCANYYKVGSEEWRALYLTKREIFKEIRDGDEVLLVVDLKAIYEPKDVEQLRNKLLPSVVKSTGTPLILYRDQFFRFINYRQPFSRTIFSFVKRIWK